MKLLRLIKEMRYVIIVLALFCFSCVKTYTVPQEIISERITHERLSQKGNVVPLVSILTGPIIGIALLEAFPESTSDLKWLPVITENGEMVEVEITRVSTFIIKTKSNETVKMLALSAFVQDGILKGKRSLLMGMAREIPIADIASIELYTENASTRPIKK
jgi:hypothetical protein